MVTVAFVMVVTFLCLRRGVSVMPPGLFLFFTFSLPTQRCFLFSRKVNERRRLFSAYAEVFLSQIALSMMMLTFLCLRRGVSHQKREKGRRLIFSLPTQRCFFCGLDCIPPGLLFSAYAEVFPTHTDQRHADRSFSLPTQRCFSDSAASCFRRHLFSAYAVVFLG